MRLRFIYLFTLALFTANIYAQGPDIRILRLINSPANLPSDGFFRFISNSDTYISVGIPAVIFSTGIIKHDEATTRNGIVCFASLAVSSGITLALKYAVDRQRPFIKYPDITKKSVAGSPSFPSGHTTSAFSVATSLSLAYPKWYVIAPSFAWAGTVGFSRMDLGVHYPSDVLAGAIIGSGTAWLTWYINKKLSRKPWEKPCNCPDM